MQSVGILTTVTVGYVPQTIVTLKSAYLNSNFDYFYVFVADADVSTIKKLRLIVGSDVPYIEFFGVDDLKEDMRDSYLKVFSYFNKFEVSNLAKYIGMLHIFCTNPNINICVYIDSDTQFFGDVRPLLKEIDGNAVYLTPHILSSLANSYEHDIMINGWINAGFFAFNKDHQSAIPILEWLIDRISIFGFSASYLGLFVDQKWLSSLPVLYHKDIFISEYAGLNVAYWNLEQRMLSINENNEVFVNKKKLIMFHFSGFDEANNKILSKHADVFVESGSILDRICECYRNELLSVKPLYEKLNELKVIECSEASLKNRIYICESIHQVNLYKTMPRMRGAELFGSKVDSIFRKLLSFLKKIKLFYKKQYK